MTTRYYAETECEDCGLTHPKGVRGVRIGDEWRVLCEGSGGSRRELTIDYEAAAHVLREKLSTNGFKMKPAKVRAGHWVPDIVQAALSGDPQ